MSSIYVGQGVVRFCVAVSRLLSELDSIVGQNGVDLIGHSLQYAMQELLSGFPVCLLEELGYGELACAINAYEQVELAFSSLNLGDVDIKVADRIAFEVLAFPPLRYGLGIDAKLSTQLRERSLRSLYCSSDGVRGRGASMTNLSHNASLHS